jgi:hypothetical protein
MKMKILAAFTIPVCAFACRSGNAEDANALGAELVSSSLVQLEWVKVRSPEIALGRYVRDFEGFEMYTLQEDFCMVLFDPRDEDPDDDMIVLGHRGVGEWSATPRGLIKVEADCLKVPRFFALVQWGGKSGLMLVDSESDSPPSRVEAVDISIFVFRRYEESN